MDSTSVRKSIETKVPVPKMMSDDSALALKISCDLSDAQYQMIRNSSLLQDSNIYPTLHKILEAKKLCYPADILITEVSDQCPL